MDKQILTTCLSQKMSTRQIALQLGKSQTCVRYWMTKYSLDSKYVPIPKYKISDVDILAAVNKSTSVSDILNNLKLCKTGNSFKLLKTRLEKLGISVKKKKSTTKLVKTESVFSKGKAKSSSTLKNNLIYLGVKYGCALCAITNWQDKPIVLQIDHIDGDRFNNIKENLRFLCPNCHSQTATYGAKNRQSRVSP